MDVTFSFPVTLVFIVISSLILHLECGRGKSEGTNKSSPVRRGGDASYDHVGVAGCRHGQNGSCEKSHTTLSTSATEKMGKVGDDDVTDTNETSTTLQTSKETKTTEKIQSSSSPAAEDKEDANKQGKRQKRGKKKTSNAEESTTLQMFGKEETTETIQSSSSPTAEHKENANRKDWRYMKGGKKHLVVALIIVAFCVGAVLMAVILCWTREKWRRRVPRQGTHHARKPSTQKSDVIIVRSEIHVETGDSIYADLNDNEDLSASNVHVSRGDDHLDQKVPLATNNYESVFERGYQRSSLEHPYDSVSLGSDVFQIATNQMERNETRNKEGKHDYFVLAINEADGKNATEGSEMRKTEENHDYFVLASHERDGENGTEGNEMGTRELNHDYFVLAPHEHNGK